MPTVLLLEQNALKMLFFAFSSNYTTALGHVTGTLAMKVGVLHLLTVRSRFITGDQKSGKEGGVVQPAETAMAPVVISLFKLVLGAFGPTYPTQKLCQLVNNAKENEPFFLAVATAIAVGGNPPAWGATALYTYCASRCVHMFMYINEFPESLLPYQVFIRATPYLVGLFTMFGLAGTLVT